MCSFWAAENLSRKMTGICLEGSCVGDFIQWTKQLIFFSPYTNVMSGRRKSNLRGKARKDVRGMIDRRNLSHFFS
jgi:hypothetical protein